MGFSSGNAVFITRQWGWSGHQVRGLTSTTWNQPAGSLTVFERRNTATLPPHTSNPNETTSLCSSLYLSVLWIYLRVLLRSSSRPKFYVGFFRTNHSNYKGFTWPASQERACLSLPDLVYKQWTVVSEGVTVKDSGSLGCPGPYANLHSQPRHLYSKSSFFWVLHRGLPQAPLLKPPY